MSSNCSNEGFSVEIKGRLTNYVQVLDKSQMSVGFKAHK